MEDIEELKRLRRQIFCIGYKGGMAHLASCYSCLEILYTLYLKNIIKYDSNNPKWDDRDRFILSKGHAGLALYSILVEVGLVKREELYSYLMPGSSIGGEPCMRDSLAIEATTGSLGHGLSIGVGMAIALKAEKKKSKVYVLVGDGEMEEGTVWEAVMSAVAFKLDNLVLILDNNHIQKMDRISNIISRDNWKEKLQVFGWDTVEVDGHNVDELTEVLSKNNKENMPKAIIANTIKGKGVSIMENNPIWHFKLPNEKELKKFISELEITEEDLER